MEKIFNLEAVFYRQKLSVPKNELHNFLHYILKIFAFLSLISFFAMAKTRPKIFTGGHPEESVESIL